MIRSVRTRWAVVASVLLVAALAAGLAQDFVHTDDGCQVEVHCLACQRVLASVGMATIAPPWHPSIEPVGRVTARNSIPTRHADAPSSASRAPPLA